MQPIPISHRRAVVALLALLATIAPATVGGLVSEGQSPELFLLYTGDVIGHLEPCG